MRGDPREARPRRAGEGIVPLRNAGGKTRLRIVVDGKPRQARFSGVSGTPDEPRDIDLDGAAVDRVREAFDRKAHVVDDVDFGGGVALECLCSPHSGQEGERQEQGRDPAGLLDVKERATNEPFMQPVAIRGIRHDVSGDAVGVSEEIDVGECPLVLAEVARDDHVPGAAKLGDDGSVAASGFPNHVAELDMGQKRPRCRRMGRVKIERRATIARFCKVEEGARIIRGFQRVGMGVHRPKREGISANCPRPLCSRTSKEEPARGKSLTARDAGASSRGNSRSRAWETPPALGLPNARALSHRGKRADRGGVFDFNRTGGIMRSYPQGKAMRTTIERPIDAGKLPPEVRGDFPAGTIVRVSLEALTDENGFAPEQAAQLAAVIEESRDPQNRRGPFKSAAEVTAYLNTLD